MRKKILITGSSGFIGYTFLKDSLNKNYHIVDILRKKNRNNKKLLKLKKMFPKSYKSIFFSKKEEIAKKLMNKKFDIMINFATLYKNNHSNSEIPKFIESNITFPTIILDSIYKDIKKFINFGTMMQHLDGKNYVPKNFYASTKSAFEMISNYFSITNTKVRYYNLKFYESFSEDDIRNKLIPTIFKNYKKNKITYINSSKLELNIVHTDDILKAIYNILDQNIKSGDYCLKNRKNIKIKNLIKSINLKLKNKIKVKYLGNILNKPTKSSLKMLPKWKSDMSIQNRIKKKFLNENN